MELEFLDRLLEFALLVGLVVWVARRIGEWRSRLRPGQAPKSRAATPAEPRPLYRDPWCGTYVSAEISRKLQQNNQTLHFCSDDCLARYVASQRRAARA